MKFFRVFNTLALASIAFAVVLPSQDPFYTQPANIASYAPGSVINSRSIKPQLNGLLPGGIPTSVKAAYQLLYRTTDSVGNPVAAVTTLLIPNNANPSKLLAYQTAYDSSNNDCSPSYAFQAGANTTAVADVIFINAALNQGWYVVSPDFEGLKAQFTAGLQAGYATLDSVRAVFNHASTSGLSKSATYAMWGYSGGALASEWASELQPSYAPELKFQGAALGGLTPNVSSVATTINKGPFVGLAFSGIYGLSKAYTNLSTYINQTLIPAKKDQFYSIANGCLSQTAANGAFMDIYSYFVNGSSTLLGQPIPTSVIAADGIMGVHGTPKIPLFIYKAIGDEVSPSADTDELVSHYCATGAVNIQYNKDVIGEHVSEAITGSASAFSWIMDRLNGKPVTNVGCTTQYVALSSISPGVAAAIGPEVVAFLQSLLGGPLGPAISG